MCNFMMNPLTYVDYHSYKICHESYAFLEEIEDVMWNFVETKLETHNPNLLINYQTPNIIDCETFDKIGYFADNNNIFKK